MTALAQAMPGLALVMGFALLGIRQVPAAAILLAIQSAATAGAAIAVHQPLLALPPLLLAALVWFVPGRLIAPPPRTLPIGGMKPAMAAAAILTVLCQSQGILALPLSVLLLGVLLAATRRSAWMRVMALVGMQNGIVLAGCFTASISPLLVGACCALPLPFGVGLVLHRHYNRQRPSHPPRRWLVARGWLPYLDLAASMAVLAAAVLVPLAPLSSAFAPLLGLDAVFQSYARRNKAALAPLTRVLALLTSTFVVLAACSSQPVATWLAVLAAIGTHFLPVLNRRLDGAVLAFVGAGVLLFGLPLIAAQPTILGYFCLFAGIVAIAAAVPELAVPLAILLLRLVIQAPWPPAATALGLTIALAALAACVVELSRRRSIALLQLIQTSIAAVALCLGTPDGRFAALVLLTLLILTRAATRLTNQPTAAMSTVALAGVPPLGVFPGLVLITLALADHHAWLLLPIGAAFVPVLLAIRPFAVSLSPSPAWLPLGLALLAGYFAPDGLVHWWHLLTTGQG
ncbi:MAG TPA: hypothetical protein DDZ81_02280 [Acetobacteraceae bacterium]|jgi:hypothetical protein|nr:hypothetical protein [Acetobacteraceae bacterium]